jgi:hypothetical protein
MPKEDKRPIERRAKERGEGSEAWNDEDRKRMLALGGLIDKWNNRHGREKQKEPKKRHPLDELLGITEE